MAHLALSAIYAFGLLIAEGLRLPHRIRRWRSRDSRHQADPQEGRGPGETVVLASILLGIWILPAVYILTDWLQSLDYALPSWVVWPAIAAFALGILLRWRAQAALGRAWSPTIELSPQHRLITEGVYAKMRHPLYTSLILWALAQPALLQNVVAGFGGAIAVALIWLIRVPAEEALLRTRFGDDYVRYSDRTGKVFPRGK
jgi:protein-S-isoprenylcysteine O-methyltransferase Ste14